MIVNVVGLSAIAGAEGNWRCAPAENRRAVWCLTDFFNVGREADGERSLAPYFFEERPIRRQRQLVGDARSIRIAHFERIDRWKLGLFRIGGPQQISGRA